MDDGIARPCLPFGEFFLFTLNFVHATLQLHTRYSTEHCLILRTHHSYGFTKISPHIPEYDASPSLPISQSALSMQPNDMLRCHGWRRERI
jgi:hypothetical protein